MTKNILVMSAMLLVCVSSASALGTPDDMPPAEETVCGAESAPGRGLCVAYCEAMDCDSDPNANQNACDNVKSKWQDKTGGTDLPCEMSCPCNDIPGYAALSSGAEPLLSCVEEEGLFISVESADDTAGVHLGVHVCFFSLGAGAALPLTPEEEDACFAQLVNQAADQDVSCEPVIF